MCLTVCAGVDVKVYAVGTKYAHAEARKAPTLDGKVNRDATGNEIRWVLTQPQQSHNARSYPVVLSPVEKAMASKVVLAFGRPRSF